LGSLLLEVTLPDDVISDQADDVTPTFSSPVTMSDPAQDLLLMMVNSTSNSTNTKDFTLQTAANNTKNSSIHLYKQTVPVRVEAELAWTTNNATSSQKYFLNSTRMLSCTYLKTTTSQSVSSDESISSSGERLGDSEPETEVGDDESNNRVSYTCTLSPLFDQKVVASNATFTLTLRISSASATTSTFAEALAVHILPTLTVVTESPDFHRALAVSRCVFLPLVTAALAFFVSRSYQNDLYVSIPDRLLISAGLALLLNNVPVEVIVSTFSAQDVTSKVKLASDLISLGPMVTLALFWSVYTADKLATNEPWERNTKYYSLSVTLVTLGACLASAYVIFTQGPPSASSDPGEALGASPFSSHWLVGTDLELVSLVLLFSLAGLALLFQTYLAVVIFRVLCDISLASVAYSSVPTHHGMSHGTNAAALKHQQQGSVNSGGGGRQQHHAVFSVWRIKMALLYCFTVSLLTVGAFLLRLAIDLGLNWNPQFYTFPIPIYMSFSSPFLLGMHGVWNLHVIGLLILLARSPKFICSGTNVYPIHYIHHKVSESNTSAADEQGQEMQSFARRQSSEDFLEYQQQKAGARTICDGCSDEEDQEHLMTKDIIPSYDVTNTSYEQQHYYVTDSAENYYLWDQHTVNHHHDVYTNDDYNEHYTEEDYFAPDDVMTNEGDDVTGICYNPCCEGQQQFYYDDDDDYPEEDEHHVMKEAGDPGVSTDEDSDLDASFMMMPPPMPPGPPPPETRVRAGPIVRLPQSRSVDAPSTGGGGLYDVIPRYER